MFIEQVANVVKINPGQFLSLIQMALEFDSGRLDGTSAVLETMCQEFDAQVDEIGDTYASMIAEAQQSLKAVNPFDKKDQDDWFTQFKHTMGGGNFISLILGIARGLQHGFHELRDTVRNVQPAGLFFVAGDLKAPKTQEELRDFALALQMNQDGLQRFVEGIEKASILQNMVVTIARGVVRHLETYHRMLRQRHSTDGVKIHGDPIRTDLAIAIFENADAHGEIQEGKKPDEISAYTQRKAALLADALCGGLFGGFVKNPGEVIDFLVTNLKAMWEASEKVEEAIRPTAEGVRLAIGAPRRSRLMTSSEFKEALSSIKELDPRTIREKDKVGLQTEEERLEAEFRNDTIAHVCQLLTHAQGAEIIQYVLQRKAEWYRIQRDENSFYVCRVSSGNSFLGEAPGALEVIPAPKPHVSLEDLVGSGFDDVREMVNQAKDSSQYNDLFKATSPSGKTDKTNVLLIGPMGCGKTEALRGISGVKGALSIFAQGSDFLTCWKGEAEKNPKRLFEAALKLNKETERQVFVSIDEIDTVLNGERGRDMFGGTNLTTEFQILMDGVVSYAGLSVWGATNHPERMSMPIIRRFAKVLLVGELMHTDRVKLLRRSLSYLPLSPSFSDVVWTDASMKLEGAVGDTVRKMADEVWRKKMRGFVNKKPDQAREVVKFLQMNGTRFDRSKFSLERRAQLETMLRSYGIEVAPEDLTQAIDQGLANTAIKAEIKTAVDTYRVARNHLVGLVETGEAAE